MAIAIIRAVQETFSQFTLSRFLQLQVNAWLFRFFPFILTRWYIICLGRLYYFFHRRESRLIGRTFCRIFHRKMAKEALNRSTKEVFKGIYDHYHEKLFVAYSNFPRLLRFLKNRIEFAGVEHLEMALAGRKGVILVTGHFGAVEFLPGALAVNGYPAAMICRFQTNRLRLSLRQRAQRVGLHLIDADDGNIILAAMKALKQGQILITECDEFEEWRPDPHRQGSFLSCRVPYDRTLEILRRRSGAPVVTALVKREGRRFYRCELAAVAAAGAAANLLVGEKCLNNLEMQVAAHPEQWYQWKKFGKMIHTQLEAAGEPQEFEELIAELAVPAAEGA